MREPDGGEVRAVTEQREGQKLRGRMDAVTLKS